MDIYIVGCALFLKFCVAQTNHTYLYSISEPTKIHKRIENARAELLLFREENHPCGHTTIEPLMFQWPINAIALGVYPLAIANFLSARATFLLLISYISMTNALKLNSSLYNTTHNNWSICS
uniref:Uncharacterized protein n=1 Tax=Candidatus Methanogaster sp. ANME-2c ERB4 TaxID=2759911 RepID=A0A7G9Y8R2_9EURY|nr:hypothetical protein NONIOKLP_00003 [Methanosarcinales archaeon ANME-2c ERB4]QNO44828.1 hypothetical protein AKKIKKOJ_00001 [Methanosarcinales archaeon ANME-2c ERB4]QNO46577.1 hypothetical protein DOHMCPNA_00001 [Methanosarcinales archaeon ANME-2c ERB4]